MSSISLALTGAALLPSAMTARHASALITTTVRGENLLFDGYSIDAGEREGLFTVTGQPTYKRTGEAIPHGPYEVDTIGGTCTCAAFASWGECKHLRCCRSLSAGHVPQMREALESSLWALESVAQPGTYRATSDTSLLYVYRSEGLAQNDCRAMRSILGNLKPAPVTLAAILESGKYAGVRLVMRGGMETILFSAAPNTNQGVRPAGHNPWALPPGEPQPYIPSDAELAQARRERVAASIGRDF